MNNQKKIEDILHSIQELILEARNEEKKDKFEIIELNKVNEFQTQGLKKSQNHDQLQHNDHAKTKEGTLIKNGSNLKSSWKDLNFEKCQKKLQASILSKVYEENFENEIEKIFKESLNLWVKKKLPDLIKEETGIFTKKILEEKLK